MTKPAPHPKSGVFRLRKAVPPALRPVLGKRELIRSLGTKDPREAVRLAPAALAEMEAALATARLALQPPRSLSLREVMALAGEAYRDMVGDHEDNPGDAETWGLAYEVAVDDAERAALRPTPRQLREAREVLAARGIPADDGSARLLAVKLADAKARAAGLLYRRAHGDYSPDPDAARFPDPPAPAKPVEAPLTGEALLAMWARERQPARATLEAYRGKFRTLARVLGFDDLRRVRPEEVARFKQARLGEGRDAGTVADDVLACGAVCRWAARNRILPDNPFAGMAPKVDRRGPARREPYSDEEAKRILTAAREAEGALRWLPWLLCFTGARIGELADLRRGDVRQEAGADILDIRPTAERAGKNATMQRMIPLHPAVLAEGFLDYLAALPAEPAGPLFPDLKPNKAGSRTEAASTNLARWVRRAAGIKDKPKAPAHSWRHRMEDELRKVRALPEVVDAITGRHNPRNAGAGYGKGFRGMPDEVLKDLARIPSPISLGPQKL